jgi:hypothetical protein
MVSLICREVSRMADYQDSDFITDAIPWVAAIGALLGVLFAEYTYFTKAEHVRLLFVLLLIPVGAFGGAVAAVLATVLFIVIAKISFYLAMALLALAIVGFIVKFLYNTVIWSN